jgi:hypothetical protein
MATTLYVPSQKDVTLKFAANLTMIYRRTLFHYPKARVCAHLVISRVGHVVITQNTDLKKHIVILATNGISITQSFVKIGSLLRKLK